MTTKEYLGQISRLNRMIDNKLVELHQYKIMACSISAVKNSERVQTSPDPDKNSTKFAKIEEMEKKMDEMIDEFVDKKEIIIKQIDSIEDEVLYDILFSRYIEKKTFEKIASDMEYSFRQTLRLHGKALQAFEKKYGHLYLDVKMS